MGTNKRYADSIDRRVDLRVSERQTGMPADAPRVALRDWQPPWPPIRIGEAEWIIMRDSKTEPVGVIRTVKLGPRNETFYRVVTWAPSSDGRELVGYFDTLAEADRSILFTPANPQMPRRPNEGQGLLGETGS
ncbi:MAG: hypothetical protein ACKVOG_07945 [Rhodoglobus sp.]